LNRVAISRFVVGVDLQPGFLNRYSLINIHERNLPHWQQAGALIFLTWRLADALPASLL
jgi:hypothetical protein